MHHLRLYVDVARCRSFSQAAAMHSITQSAASQRIGHLEKRLGVTLLDRSVRPLGLTEAGELFLHGCADLIDRYDKLERKVSALRPRPSGLVRVCAIYSAGIDLLESVKEGFEREHDQVGVELTYDQPDEVYRAVREQACDLGIVSYPDRWKKVAVVPLRDEVMSVVCAPGHALAGRRSVHAADLGRWEMVTFEPVLPAGRRIRQYLRDHGVTPDITHTFDNIDTIKGAVAVTDRIAILPTRTVAREVRSGGLVSVPLSPPLVRPIGVIHRKGPHGGAGAEGLDPAAQAFVDYLLQHAGPNVDLTAALVSPRHTPLDNPTAAPLAGAAR